MIAVAPRAPQPLDAAHPFRLNTGRVRDHWHTMTRTGLSARLSRHLAEPFLELHPGDAAQLNLAPAELAEVSSPHGRALLRVLVTDRVAPGQPFAPMHWTGATAPSGRVDALVPGLVDPVSGQPASKSAPVAIRRFATGWYGFAVSARPMRPDCDYWARATLPRGEQVELAGREAPLDWVAWAADLFGLDAEPMVIRDPARGLVRLAYLRDGVLQAALFVTPGPVGLSRSHVATMLGEAGAAEALAGRPGADRPDEGALVCACFGVGVNSILRAIASQHLTSVDAVGQALRAGTNCGSCRPEIGALVAANAACREAAE